MPLPLHGILVWHCRRSCFCLTAERTTARHHLHRLLPHPPSLQHLSMRIVPPQRRLQVSRPSRAVRSAHDPIPRFETHLVADKGDYDIWVCLSLEFFNPSFCFFKRGLIVSNLEVILLPADVTYGFGDVVDDDSCGCIPVVHGSEGVELLCQLCRQLTSRDQVLHVLYC
jgi:hypothetical protein